MEYDKLSYREAIETLAARYGLTLPTAQEDSLSNQKTEDKKQIYAALEKASQFYQTQLREHPAREAAIDYLKSRGLTGEICRDFAVGYAPPGWENLSTALSEFDKSLLIQAGLLIEKTPQGTYDRFRHRILFPIRDTRGRTVGFGGRVLDPQEQPKYLNSPETAVFQKRSFLYGLYELLQIRKPITQLIVVEGYLDVIALAQFGIPYAVATLGTATTADHIQLLLRYSKKIIFCFDGDEAGKSAAWKAFQVSVPFMTDEVSLQFLFLPTGEDPDTYVRQFGKEAFEKRLEEALSSGTYFFDKLKQGIDLRELEGQSKLAHQAAVFIAQIPGPLFQYKLLEVLANEVQMGLEELSSLVGIALPSQKKKLSQSLPTKQLSLMEKAIAFLLQYPVLIEKIPEIDFWQKLTLAGSAIFSRLLELLKANPHLKTGSLLECFRDESDFDAIAELAVKEMLVEKEAISLEFEGILKKLRQEQENQWIDALQRKAKQSPLNEKERKQLVDLITKRHDLDK